MSRTLRVINILIIFFFSVNLKGQTDFFLNGNATANGDCYQLTSTVNWEVGSIWNETQIDLNESFDISADLFLGCTDFEGADGIVFGLQPISTSIGIGGGGLGFENVTPSFGVEFDTYQNLDFDDPTFDHIAIIRDGILNHNVTQSLLAGPVQANASDENIEDCQYHPLRINWNADLQTLSIYLDCELRLTYTGDIVNEIFNGDPFVFWGFTSATGGLNNVHEVCFTHSSIIDGLVDQTICPGTSIQLEANGGSTYQWSPAIGLSDANIANPIASPEETTLYTVEIIDDCGLSFSDEILITVENVLFNVEISATPTILTEISGGTEFDLESSINPVSSNNYTYAWSSNIGSTFSEPNAATTVVTSSVTQLGTETITLLVTDEEGCTDEVSISFEITGIEYDIPNVFTPDGDGFNDVFGIVSNAEIPQFNCKIYNRWGELVFESNNSSEFWDGTFKGKTAPSDVYVYFMNLEIAGTSFLEKGDLTLIR